MSQRVEAGWVERRLEEGEALIVNVLEPERFEQAHVPGSVNVPIDSPDFDRRIQDLAPDRSRAIVVYCSGSACQASPQAARRLEALGYQRVYHFQAGIEGWQRTGHAIEKGKGAAAA